LAHGQINNSDHLSVALIVDELQHYSQHGQGMKYFVLVYNRGPGELVGWEEFSDGPEALSRRMELERQNIRGADTEIVILLARDFDSLRRTHARYFQSSNELLQSASRLEVVA
jgi:hypothetical protein